MFLKAVPYLYLSEGETLRSTVKSRDESYYSLWPSQTDFTRVIINQISSEPWIDLNSDFFVAPCAGRDAEGYRKIVFQKCAVFAEYSKTDMVLIFILAVGLLISGGCNSLPYFICWKWD